MVERRLRSKLFLTDFALVSLNVLRPLLLGKVKVIQHTITDILINLAHVGLQLRGKLLFGDRPQHLALLHKLCVILERVDAHIELTFLGRRLYNFWRGFLWGFGCWRRSAKQLSLWGTFGS